MKKYISKLLQSELGIFIIVVITLCLITWVYMSFTQPKVIHYNYKGIKYQAKNLQVSEVIDIKVDGKYVSRLFGKYVLFDGTIKIGEKVFAGEQIAFNKYNMSTLQSDDVLYGTIYISNEFKELTIEVLELDLNGGNSWSAQDGWMISAPCNNREEAVQISNMLIQRLHKNLVIE